MEPRDPDLKSWTRQKMKNKYKNMNKEGELQSKKLRDLQMKGTNRLKEHTET